MQVVNAGFLRSGLLKRLESSPHALTSTLGVMIGNHEDFLRALQQGKVLRGKALEVWGEAEEDVLVEEVVAALGDDQEETVGEIAEFHGKELIADVEADLVLLRELQALAAGVATGRDPKADRLIEKLEEVAAAAARPSRDGDLSESDRRKVIVFSTFADTIEDLHRRVVKAIEEAPATSPLTRLRGSSSAARARSQDGCRPDRSSTNPRRIRSRDCRTAPR